LIRTVLTVPQDIDYPESNVQLSTFDVLPQIKEVIDCNATTLKRIAVPEISM
jgi:hypothetical protein